MASKFFRGFSKVFKGPSNKSGFSSPTKYATIGGVKPKAKISDATKKFKSKIKETKKAIKKGTDDFKKENPKRNVTDDQIKTIQREQTEKSNKKSRKEFLREKKAVGGIAGLGKRMGRDKQRGQEGQKRKDKKKRVISSLEKVYGQVADRSRERLRKRGNITIGDIEGKMKKDITEAGKAMGGYKDGGRTKLKGGGMSQKGLGRAFKNGGRS